MENDRRNNGFNVKAFSIESNITDSPITMYKIGNIAMLNCNVRVNKEIEWGTVALPSIPSELQTKGWFYGYTDNGIIQYGDGKVLLKPYDVSLASGSWVTMLLIYPII